MTDLVLDRHVLASNATTWDTAWGTFGWTPALEGARASRLEEEVPWGTRSARLPHPPRLSGAPDEVLSADNLARLGRSFLRVDGRLGFSLWGAVGDEKVGSEWRVATHTVLMDEEEFRALAGYPDGLVAIERGLPGMTGRLDLREPAALEPLRVRAGTDVRAALAEARMDEIGRLRDAVLAAQGGDRPRLAEELAHLYEALAAALSGGRVRHVALEVDADGTGRELLRLVWLSLPLEDRLAVHYVTEQRRAERPPGHLLGLPRDEWGRYVPEDAWVLGSSEPVGPVSPGRRHLAEIVAADDELRGFGRADRRATLRGWRVVSADDLARVGEHARWLIEWERRGPTAEAAEVLASRERGRPGGPRARAVGDAAGRAMAEDALDVDGFAALARDFDEGDREALVRGAVRALRQAGRPAVAGRVRTGVTEALGGRSGPLVEGLRRLIDRESDALRALLRDPGGADALVRGAFPGAAGGDAVALELARIGVGEGRWDTETGARLADALPLDLEGGPEAAVELLVALARGEADGAPAGAGAGVGAVAGPVLKRLDASMVVELAPRIVELAPEATGGGPGSAAQGVEALRRAALLRASLVATAELDDPSAHLIRLGARTAPAHVDPRPWRELVESASARWLSRRAVLSALAGVLGSGRRSTAVVEVAKLLARRVLERAAPGSLDPERATDVLRLVWLEGDGSTLRWLVGTRPDAAAPLLARLLVTPAPLALQPAVRRALGEALDTGADRRGMDAVADELRAWAPALHERAGLSATGGDRFVPLSGPGGRPAGGFAEISAPAPSGWA